jgi:glucose-1-phosphate adenylyltransferase
MSLDTLTLLIATGQDDGLSPLTQHRAKSAVPFAGKFRVIDFILANCLHSGLRKILVLTQYKSHSLQKHLRDGWSIFHPELGEFITPVPPQMREGEGWYAGAFNAMRQNRYLIERSKVREVLLLEGALIYRMDYAELIRFHRERGAQITLACRGPGSGPRTTQWLDIDENDRVSGMAASHEPAPGDPDRSEVAPMGVYLFDKDLLLAELSSEAAVNAADRGAPAQAVVAMAERFETYAYRFGGERGRVTPDRYWSDLADIDAYYDANMALLETEPPLDLYQEDWNILTYQGQYPPARTVPGLSGTEGIFVNSMLSAGTVITGGGVNHSILFPRVRVADGAIVEDAILFNDVSVGEGAHLRRCIIDKDVGVPARARIGLDLTADRERFDVTPSGVVVIPKGFLF